MPDREADAESFTALAAAAAAGRPQFIRHNGQILILIAKSSLDEACLKSIRAREPTGIPPEDTPDSTYPEARGLLNAPLRRQG